MLSGEQTVLSSRLKLSRQWLNRPLHSVDDGIPETFRNGVQVLGLSGSIPFDGDECVRVTGFGFDLHLRDRLRVEERRVTPTSWEFEVGAS